MIKRTTLKRSEALLAFPTIGGALAGGQTLESVLMTLPPGPGYDGFTLEDTDDGTKLSVVLSHDPANDTTCIVLLERTAGPLKGTAYHLLIRAWKEGLVRSCKKVVGMATNSKYAAYVKRMFPELVTTAEPGGLVMSNTTDKV